MNINLAPYNWYIFYGALALLVVFLVVLVIHALPLVKEMKKHSDDISSIRKNVELTKIKTEAIRETKQASKKNDKAMSALLLLLAIHKAYRDKDQHSPRSYLDTAAEVLQKRKAKADLFNSLRSGI